MPCTIALLSVLSKVCLHMHNVCLNPELLSHKESVIYRGFSPNKFALYTVVRETFTNDSTQNFYETLTLFSFIDYNTLVRHSFRMQAKHSHSAKTSFFEIKEQVYYQTEKDHNVYKEKENT